MKGIQLGADSYITKPFSVQYLLARVVKLIEQREKLQRKFATEPGNLQPLISTTDRDKIFLDKINAIIERNMGDAEFKLDTYAPALGLGRTTFYSKLKSIVGCSPNEYVRLLRMKRAAELLITSDINISEAGYQVVSMILSILANALGIHSGNLLRNTERVRENPIRKKVREKSKKIGIVDAGELRLICIGGALSLDFV